MESYTRDTIVLEVTASSTATIIISSAKLKELEMDSSLKSNVSRIGNEVHIEVGLGSYRFNYPYLHK